MDFRLAKFDSDVADHVWKPDAIEATVGGAGMNGNRDQTNPRSVDTLRVLLATCVVSSIGAMIFNTMPVLLGVLAETKGFGEGDLSIMASAILIGSLIAVVSAMAWVEAVPWRPVMTASALAAAAASCLIPFFAGRWAMAGTLGGMGFLMGVLYAPSLAALARSANPPRAFAVAIAMQVGISAVIAYLLPAFLLPSLHAWSIPMVIGIACIVVVLIYPVLPSQEGNPVEVPPHGPTASGRTRSATAGALGLAAMGVFYLGVMGVWEFLERIGASWDLSPAFIGGVVALALVVGASGALVPMVIGRRFGAFKPVVLAVALLLASALLFQFGADPIRFAAGGILLNVGWNLAVPFMYAVVAEADASGRLVVFSVAVQMMGAVFGSAIAGVLIVGSGFVGLFGFFVLCVLLALAVHGEVVRRLSKLDLLGARA